MNLVRVLFFILATTTVLFGQLPAGIDPSRISKSDLDRYGISENDLQNLISEYGVDQSPVNVDTTVELTENVTSKDSLLLDTSVTPKTNANSLDLDQLKLERVYGKSFFDNKKLKVYDNASHVKAPANYILGVGDEISVTIWGYSEHSGVYAVENNGAINPRLVGKIFLKGQTFGNAKKMIKSKFSQVYDLKNSQISIELNYSKVIRINLVGEVINPGTYTVKSINSAFNVLAIAGGITANGTVRNIEIYRDGKVVKTLDVYEFLNNPKKRSEFSLMDNDFIVVNTSKIVVKIKGEVLKPGLYELKEQEGIIDLIKYSGGFQAEAYTKVINVSTIENDQRNLIELNYDNLIKENRKYHLKNGDNVEILAVPSMVRRRIRIGGAVNIPGEYTFNEGMRVSDLLEKANGYSYDAIPEHAYIKRLNDDLSIEHVSINLVCEKGSIEDIVLKEFDKVFVASKRSYKDDHTVKVEGFVRNPNTIPYSKDLSLKDVIFMSDGLLPEAYQGRIEISRVFYLNQDDKEEVATSVVVETIDLKGEADLSELDKIKLMPQDIIFVRRISGFQLQRNVEIRGEVKYPGIYTLINKNETIKDLVERAGGFTDWAFLEGATFNRASLGFVIFDLDGLYNEGKEEFNFILGEGDVIKIPKNENFILMSGAISYPKVNELNGVYAPFVKGHRASYYIKKFGAGFHEEAYKKHTFVETPGGYVKRTKRFLFWKIYPKIEEGDKIFVDYKPLKEEKKLNEKKMDWNRAIENVTVKITGILTLWILIENTFN